MNSLAAHGFWAGDAIGGREDLAVMHGDGRGKAPALPSEAATRISHPPNANCSDAATLPRSRPQRSRLISSTLGHHRPAPSNNGGGRHDQYAHRRRQERRGTEEGGLEVGQTSHRLPSCRAAGVGRDHQTPDDGRLGQSGKATASEAGRISVNRPRGQVRAPPPTRTKNHGSAEQAYQALVDGCACGTPPPPPPRRDEPGPCGTPAPRYSSGTRPGRLRARTTTGRPAKGVFNIKVDIIYCGPVPDS